MTVPRLSAGVITADLTKLGVELEILRGRAAWAHVDVMDGWSGQAPAANTHRRVAAVRELAAACRTDVLVGVDGGITVANAGEIAGWEPDIIVSGSAIFDHRNPSRNLELLVQALGRPVRVP